MKTNKERAAPPLEEVLIELALAQETPDAQLLDKFTQRYPEYAEPLTEYAIELALEAAIEAVAAPSVPSAETSASAMKAMSRFQNKQFELRRKATTQTVTSTVGPVNPFLSLDTAASRALMTRLDVTPPFLMKLRDRRIREDTIPDWFRTTLARELRFSDEGLKTHFAAPAMVQEAASFKADEKPQAPPKETFENAINSSGLTPKQQAALKRI